jgi:hypothetical protein
MTRYLNLVKKPKGGNHQEREQKEDCIGLLKISTLMLMLMGQLT